MSKVGLVVVLIDGEEYHFATGRDWVYSASSQTITIYDKDSTSQHNKADILGFFFEKNVAGVYFINQEEDEESSGGTQPPVVD